jgi:glycosyltransferase involved in cell wall biosynthesis
MIISDLQSKVLALIPAYNEADHIQSVVQKTSRFLPVLVVDDGSKDNTVEQAELADAQVLRQVPNQGKGAALKAGFRWALEHGYQAVLTLDADGQHDPDEIPLFLAAFQERRSDLIIGERNFSEMPFIRRFANSSGRILFSWAVGRPIRDNQSGYRLISKRLIETILTSHEAGFEYEVEMIVSCVRKGYVLDGVPIRTIYADEKSHISPLKHVQGFINLVLKTRRAMQQKE